MPKVRRALVRCYLRHSKWCNECPAHETYLDEDDGWTLNINNSGILKAKRAGWEIWFPPEQLICVWRNYA